MTRGVEQAEQQSFDPNAVHRALAYRRGGPDIAFAEGDEYEEILARIRRELALRFSDPDDPRLLERRRRLRSLFASIPPGRARELHDRLGTRATSDQLSRAFHGRLATATRTELLKILWERTAAATPPPKPPAWVDTAAPLPADAEERFRAALRVLELKAQASTDARAWRYRCWLSKLKAGADDRVIKWHRICPRTSGAIGAAFIVGPCDITAGSAVDQAELQAAITSVDDVEQANRRLRFITHIRSDILFTHEMISESLHLESFRTLHDEVGRAVAKLDLWANNPMGGSSAMPRAYIAIKDWIGRRQRDAKSVYSCM
jgi:hypothetical protein